MIRGGPVKSVGKRETFKKPPLHVAVHEAGHAVAIMFSDDPRWIDFVTLRETPEGSIGYVQSEARFKRYVVDIVTASATPPEQEDLFAQQMDYYRRAARLDVIDTMAGGVAEMRFRKYSAATRFLCMSNAIEQAAFQAHTGGAKDDFLMIYERLHWLDPNAIYDNFAEAWDETEALVKAHWAKIEELGRWLHRDMHIDDDALIEWGDQWPR